MEHDMPSTVSLNVIEDFLQQKRIGIIGLSRDRHHISNALLKEFEQKGFEVAAVNPNVTEIDGRRCFSSVQDIQPAPDAVLIFTPPHVTESIVRECNEVGIRRVWMYRGGGKGAVSAEAVDYCRKNGIEVIPGECPFMFLDPVHGVHAFHRFCSKLFRSYPQHNETAI
jgi:uncharacterized protein